MRPEQLPAKDIERACSRAGLQVRPAGPLARRLLAGPACARPSQAAPRHRVRAPTQLRLPSLGFSPAACLQHPCQPLPTPGNPCCLCLQYHSSVTLSKYVTKGIAAYMNKKAGGRRKGQQQGGQEEEEEEKAEGPKTSLYLTINGQVQRRGFRSAAGWRRLGTRTEPPPLAPAIARRLTACQPGAAPGASPLPARHPLACRKGDIWILSNHPLLHSPGGGGAGDRLRQPWSVLCRSEWHGPDRDGKFAIEFLGAAPPGLGQKQGVFALKGPDVATEVAMQRFISQRDLAALEVLPALLQRPSAPAPPEQAQAQAQGPGWQQQAVEAFALNPEQAQVLAYVARWLQANPPRPASSTGLAQFQGARPAALRPKRAAPAAAGVADGSGQQQGVVPVCLVHGPFGSGK
jgi:hypothetical protein